MEWRSHATLETLRARADLLALVRRFFDERGVMEVDTPLLASHSVCEPHLHPFKTHYSGPGVSEPLSLYLQTSPEYAMKRLLACGVGSIYQLGKAFRQGELGTRHNPEFSLLEWYRVDWDYQALMQEVSDLLTLCLEVPSASQITYAELFEQYTGINPHLANRADLDELCMPFMQPEELSHSDQLDLIFSHKIEPHLGQTRPVFVVDYPSCQSELARVEEGCAKRFELFYKGLELANGYEELTDAKVLKKRWEQLERDYPENAEIPLSARLDGRLMAAMQTGLPTCSGVALGFDRLLMLKLGVERLEEVICFTAF